MSASLFSLPLELREQIYSLYFKPSDRLLHSQKLNEEGFYGGVYRFEFQLLRVNKQIYNEANAVWQRENVFVKIATPWPSAVNHIAHEGLVPIVCTDGRADKFTTEHALVSITAPFHQAVPEHTVVVLADDIHLFSQTWYYSALSYPMLNDRLSTTFTLLKPSTSLQTQRRLLLPFTQIKGLYSKEIINYASEVRLELETGMSTPLPTLSQCCESAADLMAQGDALVSTDPKAALDLYTAAFRAIHILIHGRTRRVLADAFFHHPITTGRFMHQTGLSVRIVLRLKLVSRTVLAHLKMRNPAEALFWGMRSINIMRESMDVEFEDFVHDFVGGEDVSWIYMRAGIAAWMIEKQGGGGELDEGSEELWTAAGKFVKKRDRKDVRRELRGFGVDERTILERFGDGEKGSASAQDGSGDE
ncbi:hypothetical protein HBI56_008920 [Parastagonospora nodorum]|uniref:Uncharacterized protein n=1 Tax=Phaeosphaeria nodorum (strain SN15 / ATCC MYA-4574 / FGSC 10173) TaxID=321614 RepID=A0A7U2HUM5_PHANO|nr:hypothetical protein HBH56_236380 [Parastagonospora nodorum]QRC90929.1 hypothetical protein JI435_004420 [Parastagonospora nodorum SN15]KAH3935322.1 hypothetical protein HBH54_046350 [Parastagonospora nodorum]KAH3950041.1 hypothetical protein HBH53_077610 [Parastagonospora nodorum]KAH3986657.1 hypothetical protein HBH51_010660 [Parastagonospora nodorum]